MKTHYRCSVCNIRVRALSRFIGLPFETKVAAKHLGSDGVQRCEGSYQDVVRESP